MRSSRNLATELETPAAPSPDLAFVGDLSELEPHGQFSRWVENHDVLVYRFNGQVKAISNICRHFGGPIGFHKMKDGVFTCLWHCYKFNAADGACQTNPKLAAREYKVAVKDSRIYVQLVEA